MRILALSSWWPEPADNGIKLRISRLLQHLAARHEIHLLALDQSADTRQRLPLDYGTSADMLPAARAAPLSWPARMASLWRAAPASVRATWSQPFADLVRARAAALRPDLVIAFELASAPYALLLADLPRLLDDLEMATIYDRFAHARGRQRLRAWLTWAKHAAYVRQVLSDFAACTAVSERERWFVGALAPAKTRLQLVANGADMGGPPAAAPEPDTLIYPGTLSYAANLDAMRYFLGEIFPLVRAARPAARLLITGKATPEQRAALPASEGVEFTGFVDDIRALVARSCAEVVPLRQGSGTRLKILEALALGTPVVTTSKGCEGLDLAHGSELLVSDSPQAFAQATTLLLGQPALRRQLGLAGQRAVAAKYDWQHIAAKLDELIQAVGERSAPYVSYAA